MQSGLTLQQRWLRRGRRYGAGDALLEATYADIARRYGERHRSYHTLQHLEAMFADCDRFGVDSAAVDFAVWFHDIVYRPGSAANEARSARLAAAALASTAVMRADGISTASAIAMAPLPTPRSRTCGAGLSASASSAASTSSSVSGRGTSTPGPTSRSSDQKPRLPVR